MRLITVPEMDLASLTNAAPFWGPVVAILAAAVIALYRRNNALQDKLFEFAMKSVESDKDTKAALDKNADASRQVADAMNRIADKLPLRA